MLGAAYVDAGKQQANPFTQHFIEFTQTQCWGNVWLRDGLSHKTRSMLNVCMLAALARWHEFEVHVRGALNNGVTAEEVAEICCIPPSMRVFRSRQKGFAAPTKSLPMSRWRRSASLGLLKLRPP